MIRRSSRLVTPPKTTKKETKKFSKDVDVDAPEESTGYVVDGVSYDSYQEMVQAKRLRNQQRLVDSGLLQTVQALKDASQTRKPTTSGIKRRKSPTVTPISRRKSNRIAGLASDGRYVEEERAGKFTLSSTTGTSNTGEAAEESEVEPEFYRGRMNDGENISIVDSVNEIGSKWLTEDSVAKAEATLGALSALVLNDEQENAKRRVQDFASKIDSVSVDGENCVAKVVPDRIYGMAVHPSTDKLLVCAGDKSGYVGLWNADEDANDHTSLFKFHSGAASCLSWTPSGRSLVSGSYDGTVRVFDVEKQCFEQAFGTYDDSKKFSSHAGANMDTGYRYWTQYASIDHRSPESGIFVSTSVGTAMHIDWRMRTKVSFHESLSEKKINSLSLHSNGYTLLSGGLDCHVQTWDMRKFADDRSSGRKTGPKSIASYNCGKSVNSAYFSPSGKYVVATTMANKLDIFENAHTAKQNMKPMKSVRHDNLTGRWLSTFMATWHPSEDVFCVGSMGRPRAVDVFSSDGSLLKAVQGDALTAVASRCCFHPRADRMVIVGGNSSGRVTVIR